MEEDIRRSGKLYLHQKRFGRRWKKVWCLLMAESRRSVARLELFEHKQMSVKEGSSKRKPEYKQVIRLRECIRISENLMDDCPKDCASFILETTDKLYVFAAHQSEAEEWIQCLCEQAFHNTQIEQRLQRSEPVSNYRKIQENSLYDTADCVRDFVVVAVGTDSALRCNLHGEYILTAQLECLILKDSNTRRVLFKWPYCYVRKFGQDTLSFSFEAGRRCESGEGNFEFATHQGEQIFSIINEAIEHLPKTSSAKPSGSTHEIQSRKAAITERIYDDINPSDHLPEDKMLHAVQHSMKRLSSRSLSLNATHLRQVIKTKCENEEPVYAMVSKAQPKPTSSTNPQTHLQKKAVHQFGPPQDSCPTDAYFLQSAFLAPQEDEDNDETVTREDSADSLSDSIHQLTINDAVQNITAEAIYADPQDLEPITEWDVDVVYDEPEGVIKGDQRAQDEVDGSAQGDFLYIPDTLSSQVKAAQSSPSQSSENLFSEYDNLKLKGRRV